MTIVNLSAGGAPGWDNAGYGIDQGASISASPPAEASFPQQSWTQAESFEYVSDEDYWATFPETLTTADLAKILRVGRPAVRSRLRNNIIPVHRIAGSQIMFKQEIRAWLARASNQPLHEPAPTVDVLAPYEEEMTYRDLMHLFGKTKQTIYAWLTEGHVPASSVGGRWLIFKSQIKQLLIDTSNQNEQEQQL